MAGTVQWARTLPGWSGRRAARTRVHGGARAGSISAPLTGTRVSTVTPAARRTTCLITEVVTVGTSIAAATPIRRHQGGDGRDSPRVWIAKPTAAGYRQRRVRQRPSEGRVLPCQRAGDTGRRQAVQHRPHRAPRWAARPAPGGERGIHVLGGQSPHCNQNVISRTAQQHHPNRAY